jgi:hypothetical protein
LEDAAEDEDEDFEFEDVGAVMGGVRRGLGVATEVEGEPAALVGSTAATAAVASPLHQPAAQVAEGDRSALLTPPMGEELVGGGGATTAYCESG